MSDDRRTLLARTFDDDAERYAARRPGYPAALVARIAEYGRLGPDARVLEIAPGTGQATRALAERGWAVRGVELGARMAAVARRELAGFPRVEIVTGAFEEQPPPAAPFDAVVCATAWHWLDPAVRMQRAAAALRPGGVLAVIWTHHVRGGSAEFFADSQACYRDVFPGTPFAFTVPDEAGLDPSTAEQAAAADFTDVQDHRFPLEVGYTADEYIDLLRTYSDTAALDPAARERFLGCIRRLLDDRHGGRVVKRYLFELVLARRR